MSHWTCRLLIVGSIIIVYAPIVRHDFVDFDDQLVITQNPVVQQGLRVETIGWAFTTTAFANWMPLTWLTHLLDWELFGPWAGGHHLTSMILHIVGSILLFEAFRSATGRLGESLLIALVFALHPLHVESVAWVSERKGILSTTFWMLAVILYVHYTRQPSAARMWAVTGAMVAGLMSKPMLVTLPAALLLLDAWPLGRYRGEEYTNRGFRRFVALCFENWPLALAAAGFAPIAYFAQHQGEAISTFQGLPISYRLINAEVSAVTYLRRYFWPDDLAVFYPHPRDSLGWVTIGGSLAVLILLSVTALLARRRLPWVFTGWLWYLITLIPVCGIVAIGSHGMADRYSDIPLLGITLALVFSLSRWTQQSGLSRLTRYGLAAILVGILAGASITQVRHWRNTETLFTSVLEHDPDNFMALNELGMIARRQGDTEKAVSLLERAVQAEPSFTLAHFNLGLIRETDGDLAAAEKEYREAAEWGKAESWFMVARMQLAQKKVDDAIVSCEYGFGAKVGTSADWTIYGYLLLVQSRFVEAERALIQAVSLDESNAHAYRHLGMAQLRQGKLDEARRSLATAVAIDPTIVDMISALVEQTEEKDLFLLDMLAACLSQVDQPGLACKKQEAALLLAARQGQTDLIPGMQERLRAYLNRERYLNFDAFRFPGGR